MWLIFTNKVWKIIIFFGNSTINDHFYSDFISPCDSSVLYIVFFWYIVALYITLYHYTTIRFIDSINLGSSCADSQENRGGRWTRGCQWPQELGGARSRPWRPCDGPDNVLSLNIPLRIPGMLRIPWSIQMCPHEKISPFVDDGPIWHPWFFGLGKWLAMFVFYKWEHYLKMGGFGHLQREKRESILQEMSSFKDLRQARLTLVPCWGQTWANMGLVGLGMMQTHWRFWDCHKKIHVYTYMIIYIYTHTHTYIHIYI